MNNSENKIDTLRPIQTSSYHNSSLSFDESELQSLIHSQQPSRQNFHQLIFNAISSNQTSNSVSPSREFRNVPRLSNQLLHDNQDNIFSTPQNIVNHSQHVINQSPTSLISPLFPDILDPNDDFDDFQSFIDDNDEINNDIDNISDIEEQNVQQLIQDMGNVKAGFYLRHSMAFFLTFLLLARLVTVLIDDSSCIKEIFVVLYAYLCYAFLEEINLYKNYKTSDHDTKIYYIYAGLDVMSLICSLLIIHLKFLKILPSGRAVASMPGLVICTLFYFSSYRRKSAKNMFLVKRMMETIQIYLIEAKTDGHVNISWKFLLAYTWIYIAFRVLLLMESLKFAKTLIPSSSRKAEILLKLWHYIYIILLLSVLVIYFGYSQFYDSKGDVELLKTSLTGGQYCSALLFCFTMLMKPFLLMIFSRASSMDYQYTEFGETILDPLNIGVSRKLQEGSSNVYFSMVSPTYYQLLNQRISPKNTQRLKDLAKFINRHRKLIQFIIKNKVKQIKKGVFQNNGEHSHENGSSYSKNSAQNEVLRIPFMLAYTINNALIRRILLILNKNPASAERLDLDIQELDPCESSLIPGKTGDSLNEIIDEKKEQNICYVCFQRVADGIIIECGHGGFCYECAIKYILGKSECMACRGFAKSVARIDNEPLFDNIFKGYMIGRVMLVMDSERCKWIMN